MECSCQTAVAFAQIDTAMLSSRFKSMTQICNSFVSPLLKQGAVGGAVGGGEAVEWGSVGGSSS